MDYKLVPVDSSILRQQVIELLAQNKLPVSDLDETKKLFALLNTKEEVIGSGGLEFFGDTALLRSVCIKKSCMERVWANK